MRKARRWQSQMNIGRIEPWPIPALRCHVIGIDCSRPSRSRAEIVTYLRMAAECRPPYYRHFQTHTASPMRLPRLAATTLATSGLNRSLRPEGLFIVDKPARVPRLDTGTPFLVSFLDFLGPFFGFGSPFWLVGP